MRQRILVSLGSIPGGSANLHPRTSSEWDVMREQEAQELTRKTVKILLENIATLLYDNDGAPVDVVARANLAEQISTLRSSCASKDAFLEHDGAGKLQKNILASAIASLHIEMEKEKEKKSWAQWEDDLGKIIASASGSGLHGEPVNLGNPNPSPAAVRLLLTHPSKTPNKQHWDIQRAAALLTYTTLGSYAGLAQADQTTSGASGLEEFVDRGLDQAYVSKNKMYLGFNELDQLNTTCLAFAGRFVPVPCGQPASFLKSKFRVEPLGYPYSYVVRLWPFGWFGAFIDSG